MRRPLLILPLALLTIGAAPASVERRFMLTDFNRVRMEGPFVVEIVSGNAPGAVVTGEPRAIDRANLRVDGGTLVIAASTMGWDGWREDREGELTIRVTARQIAGARVNGGGRLSIERLVGQRIDLALNGSGRLTIGSVSGDQLFASLGGTGAITLTSGTVRTARFFNQGAGSIDAAGMRASALTVQSQSSGDSRFAAGLTAQVMSMGTGAVRVEGPAVCRLSGPGPASCAGTEERR